MTERRDPSAHNQLVRFWCDLYLEKFGDKYPFLGGKDGKTIKELRAVYTDDELQTFMRGFFEMDDPFIEDAGHSLGVFRGCLPKVIKFVRRRQSTPSVSKAVVEPMKAWLDAKKASGV